MAKAQQQSAQNEEIPVPDYLKKFDFDHANGDTFGGSSDILTLNEGEVAGPLTLVAIRNNVDLGNGMGSVTMYEARDNMNAIWRLPIAANFRRQAEAANLKSGDVFAVKRIEDQIKKHGVGKGNPMEMYVIKVITRAPQSVAA